MYDFMAPFSTAALSGKKIGRIALTDKNFLHLAIVVVGDYNNGITGGSVVGRR